MKYNSVITIRSSCDKLLNMQINSLKDLNMTIIPFKNTTSEGYLLDIIKLQNVEWVINIDEDAFIKDNSLIEQLIEYMDINDIAIMGPPDGGLYSIRTEYPYVFNAFFTIFNLKKLKYDDNELNKIKELCNNWGNINEKDKFEYCNNFKEKVKDLFPYKITNKFNGQGSEPYYPVFIYLQENNKFEWLFCKDTEEYKNTAPATEVYTPNNKLLLVHTWLARFYNDTNLHGNFGINHNVSFNNFERINYFYNKNYLNSKYDESNTINTINISNNILDNFQLLNDEYLVSHEYYYSKSGMQEYRLYSYITTFFNNITILDIGTLDGRSAIALSHNETNKVISYNIINQIPNNHKIYTKKNIEFRIKNVLEDLNEKFIQNVKIIMIDIDHYKTIEEDILQKLRDVGFSGIILLDDIHHPEPTMNKCMKDLWENIPEKKVDVTKYGHYSGTGLVFMNYDNIFNIILKII